MTPFEAGWKVVKQGNLVLTAEFIDVPKLAIIFGAKYGQGNTTQYPVVVELADKHRIRLATITFTVNQDTRAVNFHSITNTKDAGIAQLENGNPLDNDDRVHQVAKHIVDILAAEGAGYLQEQAAAEPKNAIQLLN